MIWPNDDRAQHSERSDRLEDKKLYGEPNRCDENKQAMPIVAFRE
jgi:hypothetical protein